MLRRLTYAAPTLLLCMAALVAGVAGCGGDGGPEATPLTVTMVEWEIEVSPADLTAGSVRLEVQNEGTLAHRLVAVKSDLPPAELPVVDARVDTARVNLVSEAVPVDPGATLEGDAAAVLDLSPGKYVLFCDVVADGESHYQNGMFVSLLVEP